MSDNARDDKGKTCRQKKSMIKGKSMTEKKILNTRRIWKRKKRGGKDFCCLGRVIGRRRRRVENKGVAGG